MKNSVSLKQAMQYISENKSKVNSKYRLKFHLMGECGWINDPNGFIFFNGVYHCFFQYNPFKPFWGPTYWGHAVSKDLVKWEHLPVALAPDEEYDRDGCFSGSAIEIDGKLYIMYTGHIEDGAGNYYQRQCIAWSIDGIKFEKYFRNPVIDKNNIPQEASKRDFRDPKVFQKGDFYYAVIASQSKEGKGQILLYRSRDLLKWEYVNTIVRNENIVEGDIWECPDLFELEEKDVLLFSVQQKEGDKIIRSEAFYCVGKMDFEKGVFKINSYEKLDWGKYFYAPQTTMDEKGRRLMIAWMDNWNCPFPTQEGHNWAGALTLPRELYLKNSRLIMEPVREIKNYRKDEISIERIINDETIYLNFEAECIDVEIDLVFMPKAEFEISIFSKNLLSNSVKIWYESVYNKLKFIINDLVFNNEIQEVDIFPLEDKISLRFLLDKSSIEIFVNKGEKVLTNRIYPLEKYDMLSISSKGKCEVKLRKWDLDL